MLQRTATVLALSGAILFACGCQGKAADEATIQKSLHQQGTANLMDEVAKAPEYHPPAEGRLTEAQVKMYLDVRQREQQIREVALKARQEAGEPAPADSGQDQLSYVQALATVGDQPGFADIATADLRAAQELGVNPKEYRWVKERVLEAQMQETALALSRQIAQSRQQVLAQLEQRRQETTDPVQKAQIERQIEDFNKNLQATSVSAADPVRQANAALLARYKDDLTRLQTADQRISHQLQSRPEGGESPSGGR
ncbi:MAG TPA: hypothetical protein VGQ28_13900 [Thermoanaerobaculia bacterium]|jgi:hypothetical protein|nr:hypothetical protein [Thermoanaerobaculia bacterium]